MAKAKKTKSKATSSVSRRKKKSPGARSTLPSTLTLDPRPGPSSTATESETQHSTQVQPPQPQPTSTPSTSSLPQTGHNPYLWNAAAWAAVHHHPQTAPSFTTVNPLQTLPTFAPTTFTHAQHTENVTHRTAESTTPVPLGPHVAPQSPESTQHLAKTITPPRERPQSPSSGSETDDTSPSPSKSSRRIRISRRNPIHGLVEGAMSGNQEYNIARKAQLRDLQPNASLGGRRFKRQMEDIVCRAERLSLETECWLVVCAQLPGSGPSYHYTSPRFRREALADASDMVSTFHDATYALNLAKRKDAKDITASYEKRLADAESHNKQVEERGRQREQELLAQVEDYRALLASKLRDGPGTDSVPQQNPAV